MKIKDIPNIVTVIDSKTTFNEFCALELDSIGVYKYVFCRKKSGNNIHYNGISITFEKYET